MSYYFRQQVMKRGVEAALNAAANQQMTRAAAGWDESRVNRGKTTPASTPGSFAPGVSVGGMTLHARPRGGARVNEFVIEDLHSVGKRADFWLRTGAVRTKEALTEKVVAASQDLLGPNFRPLAEELAYKVWEGWQSRRTMVHLTPLPNPHVNFAIKAERGLWL